jgi:exosome complex component RRP4
VPTFFERRQIVAPGDLIAEGDYTLGENTYAEDNKIYASRLGIVEYEDKKIIVIGTVVEVGFNGWTVDINAPYGALLRASEVLSRPFKPQKDELSQFLNVGDLVVAKITAYDRSHDPQLSVNEPGLGKITRGQIIKITSTKIPRVIGRKGSMISMITSETGCQIILGLNGVILVTGKTPEEEELALLAIRRIEEESHKSGLTDRITQMLKKEKTKQEEK